MRKFLIPVFASLVFTAAAQEPVAPTTGERVGSPRGDNVGPYNVVQSWEFGYRYHEVGGDVGKYRSDVNYRNGFRLLSGTVTANSRDGHGKWFDEVVLTTQGLGNDPYESVILRAQKNRLYRYDMTWRLNEYFNPGLATAGGLHLADLSQRWQDHEVTLFPQSKFRIRAGYGRNKEDGPALSTNNLFENQRGDIFTLFSNVKREYNSYRLGADLEWMGVRMSILRRWEFYKEDTPYSLGGPSAGQNPTDISTLTGFNRANPIHGATPSWLATIMTEKRFFAVNGRMAYAGGNRAFVQNESATGTGFVGTENRLAIAYGNAQRPVTHGDLNLTVFPGDRLSITNYTSASNVRINGNAFYEQFDLSSLSFTLLNFQFLGDRMVTNSTGAHFRVTKKLDVFAGYRYSNREIRSIQTFTTDPKTPFVQTLNSQENHVHAGIAGMNWIIAAPLRLHVETEIARNDNPFTPIDQTKYHTIDARLQYRRKALSGAAGYKQAYNNNAQALTSFGSHSRNYFANGAWTRGWLSLDAGYNRLHLDTAGGVLFFAGAPRATQQKSQSIYLSNIHAANLGARIAVRNRADIYIGYNVTRDTGDGRSAIDAPTTVAALLTGAQTFPLSFQSPLLRLTIPITDKIKWNAGYQYYAFHQDFSVNSVVQSYHAHTGYTSILWAF